MAVDQKFQGLKIGKQLAEVAIEKAKEKKANKIILCCELWRIDEVAADKPTWALPLAYGSFGLQEMVQQNPHIKEILIVDDVLTLVYRGDDLVIRGRDYLPALSTDLPLLMTDTIARFVVPPLQGFTIFGVL